jgi:hypothetical protein
MLAKQTLAINVNIRGHLRQILYLQLLIKKL